MKGVEGDLGLAIPIKAESMDSQFNMVANLALVWARHLGLDWG